jgi:hypothetical protein
MVPPPGSVKQNVNTECDVNEPPSSMDIYKEKRKKRREKVKE